MVRLTLLVFLVVFFFIPRSTYAADVVVDYLYQYNCGLLNKSCCKIKPIDQPPNLKEKFGGVSKWPVIGGAIDALDTVVDTLNRNIVNPGATLLSGMQKACIQGYPTPDATNPSCTCTATPPGAEKDYPTGNVAVRLCQNIKGTSAEATRERATCEACAAQNNSIWTGIGCVKSDVAGFVQETVLGWGLRFAGIFSLFCIMYAAIQIQLSRGNPEKIKKAQEMMTSCIMGLLLIIFSIFILRVIGVNILRIPGLG